MCHSQEWEELVPRRIDFTEWTFSMKMAMQQSDLPFGFATYRAAQERSLEIETP